MSIKFVAALVGVASVAGIACEAAAQAQEAPLTRENALTRALADDLKYVRRMRRPAPRTRAFDRQGAEQPLLGVQRENIEGEGLYRGSDRAGTASLSQPLNWAEIMVRGGVSPNATVTWPDRCGFAAAQCHRRDRACVR